MLVTLACIGCPSTNVQTSHPSDQNFTKPFPPKTQNLDNLSVKTTVLSVVEAYESESVSRITKKLKLDETTFFGSAYELLPQKNDNIELPFWKELGPHPYWDLTGIDI